MVLTDVRARVVLLGLILGVPLVGLAVSSGLRVHLDNELRASRHREAPAANPSLFAGVTVAKLCASQGPVPTELCQTDTGLAFMRTASLGAGLAGLALVAAIAVAGNAARSNRSRLLSLFRPGLYVAALATTGLILVHAIIAITVIYYGETTLVNTVHGGFILAIGLGAIAGVAAVARSAFGMVRKAETAAVGTALAPGEARVLWDHVAAIARRLGSLQPDHIVVGLDPTFFVTEANVVTPNGVLTGRTLFCSLPLTRILTVEELTAIVGHELGHFRGEDTQFSEQFYPIYRGTATALARLQAAGGRGSGVVSLLPAMAIFGFFLERFSSAEREHGRSRELLADQAGVEVGSARTMAVALVKVHAFAGAWRAVQGASLKGMREGKAFKNASVVFADVVKNNATSAALSGIADAHTSHPTDTHPSLAVRLESLNLSVSEVATEALSIDPQPSAASLLPDVEAQEEALSRTYQALLAREVGIELPPAEQQQPSGGRSPIRRCIACGTKVLPKQDGRCPSCGAAMAG